MSTIEPPAGTLYLYPDEKGWIICHGRPNRRFTVAVQSQVDPNHRRYDPGRRCWVLHPAAAIAVRAAMLSCFVRLETFEEAPRADGERRGARGAAGGAKGLELRPQAYLDACRTLYIQPDAPLEVVKAIRRELAKLYHPDRDEKGAERMAKVNAAFDVVLQHKSGRT